MKKEDSFLPILNSDENANIIMKHSESIRCRKLIRATKVMWTKYQDETFDRSKYVTLHRACTPSLVMINTFSFCNNLSRVTAISSDSLEPNCSLRNCHIKAGISESERTSVARQRFGNYVPYHCLGMPESRISGLNLETSFPRKRTKAFPL
jgi:hypothetical protein